MTSAAAQQNRGVGAIIADRYVVRGVLGEGGMGQVLRVEHLALGRPFALKTLRLEKWSDELVRRFNREARALARITTPRVAQITDFGVDGEVGPFYVMELVDGETLEQRIEREERLAPARALTICAELCDALAEVHAAGIVHRDLKPSNVGLPTSGPVGVKLLDFGLAAAMDEAFLSKITESQQILGSLPYMAPEQFNAAPPTPAMDVYALGVVLFEALTGTLPFHAPSTAALIHQILAAPVPPLPSGLPELLRPLLEQLLGKAPHQRFASATAAGQAIREVAAALGAHASATGGSAAESCLPKTSAERADVGLLPTLGTPTPVSWAAPSESGMRLNAGVPTPSAPPPRGASGWQRRLIVLGVLGVTFGALAAVGSVIALSTWSRRDPTPPSVQTPPTSSARSPVIDARTSSQAAEPRAAEPRAAEPRAAEPRAAEPRAAEPRAAEPDQAAETDQAQHKAVRFQRAQVPERGNRTPRAPATRPPPLEPVAPLPLPPAPETLPRPVRGSSPPDESVIRQW